MNETTAMIKTNDSSLGNQTLLGKPVLSWSIAVAKEAESVAKIIVCSDNEKILALAKHEGADTASFDMKPTNAEIVLELNPATPLRTTTDLNRAVQVMIDGGFDTVQSCSPLTETTWTGTTDSPSVANAAFVDNASIALKRIHTKQSKQKSEKTALLPMKHWQGCKADTIDGLEICEWLARKHGLRQKLFPFAPDDVRLIAYDFDGVMTNNCAYLSQEGIETVKVNRSDGLVILKMAKMGIKQVVISKERNPVVLRRTEKLGLEVTHACDDKVTALKQYCESLDVPLEKTVFFGNDLNDIEVMEIAGTTVAPADATPAAKAKADIITKAKGGEGVIREFYDILFPNQ